MNRGMKANYRAYASRAAVIPARLEAEVDKLKTELISLYAKEAKILKILDDRDKKLELALQTQSDLRVFFENQKSKQLDTQKILERRLEASERTASKNLKSAELSSVTTESLKRKCASLVEQLELSEKQKQYDISVIEDKRNFIENNYRTLQIRYESLSNSKLGRIQINYWFMRAKMLKKRENNGQ